MPDNQHLVRFPEALPCLHVPTTSSALEPQVTPPPQAPTAEPPSSGPEPAHPLACPGFADLDEAERSVFFVTFRDAYDSIPRPVGLSLTEFGGLVATASPRVHQRAFEETNRRMEGLAEALAHFEHAKCVSASLRGCREFRDLEKAAWISHDAETRAANIAAAAAAARATIASDVKRRLPLWSPVEYRRGTTRGSAGVLRVTMVVFDYDDGTTLAEALGPWTAFVAFAATTWSHTEATPRFRLILPLERPVPVALWDRAWRWAAERAAGKVDPSCKDAARMYVLPALSGPDSPYVSLRHNLTGPLLDIPWETLPPVVRLPPSPAWTKGHGTDAPFGTPRFQLRHKYATSVEARRWAAETMGATVNGTVARGVACPSCARRSVWFYLTAGSMAGAACDHRSTCGWTGFLDELVASSVEGAA